MRKSIFSILLGLGAGILIILGVYFYFINGRNEDNKGLTDTNKIESEFVENETESELLEEGSESLGEETENSETQMSETEETQTEEPQSQKPDVSKPPKENSTSQTNTGSTPYYIKVNRQANCVTIYKKDANGKYTVPVKAMTCSVGLTGVTPLGVNKITERYKWRPLFGGVHGQYAVRFNGHILFHSVPYTKQSKDALKPGEYNLLGQPASQGCVRLSVADAKWIYDNCKNGTKVEVYDSPDPGPLGKPVMPKINENSPLKGWDPTDPDPANPWKKGKVSISGVKNISILQGQGVSFINGVTATDVDGLPIKVSVSGSVDINKPGTYTIAYNATGVTGITATATAIVTVNPVAQPEPDVPETEQPGNSEQPGDSEQPGTSETPGDTELPGDSEIPEGTEQPGDTELPEELEILDTAA